MANRNSHLIWFTVSPSMLFLAGQKSILQWQLDHGTLKSQWKPHRWKLLGGLAALLGRVKQVSLQVLQTDTTEDASKILPHHAGMIFLLCHLRQRTIFIKNIFGSCSKSGASITSAVDSVTWPVSEWNINSFNIELLCLSNTVLYQHRRNALKLFAQKKKKYYTPICQQYYGLRDVMIYPISWQNTHFHTQPSMHTHRLVTVCG